MTNSPKRSLRTLLALLAALAMIAAACGSDSAGSDAGSDGAATESEADGTETTEGEGAEEGSGEISADFNVGLTFDIGGRGDQSFNDSAVDGMDLAVSDFGVTASEAEPNADGSNRAELLRLQADTSALVLGIGYLFEDDVPTVAAEYPDVNFAVIDSKMVDSDNGDVPLGDNIAGLTFAEEQGSFLVGAAAALMSTTGKVGFIGGVGGFGLIEKFEAGFAAGAQAVNPDIEIVAQYITMAPDFDGFYAPDRAQQIALEMYGQGADIIFHAAGLAGSGLFEAAKSHSAGGTKVWAIGVDKDQYLEADPAYQEFILTSMLKRVDVAVYDVIKAQAEGTFVAGNTVYDLSVDGVGYSTSGGFIDDFTDQLEDFKAQIIAGDIVVPTEP